MKIKEGYGEKELQIRLCGSSIGRSAEMWIEFGCEPRKETLSYLTLDELLDLRQEIQKAIKDIIENDKVDE